MVDKINRSTRTDLAPKVDKDMIAKTPQQMCEANGGTWDAERGVCVFPSFAEKEPVETRGFDVATPQIGPSGLDASDPRVQEKLPISEIPRVRPGGGWDPRNPNVTFEQFEFEKRKAEEQARQLETERLAGQVGQIQPSPTTPTEGLFPGVDIGESVKVGLREAIPRALTLAGGAAVAGATAGIATGGIASVPLAVGAAAVTFVASITASILGNMKSQRADDTTAQQRTLDEGKQALQDWTTQAAADPSSRAVFVSLFNSQLQLIQDAHVQMLTDTNADVLKFETSIPNLAEFNSFYSVGGERDALVSEMLRSLNGGVGELELNFRMIEMANRRVNRPSEVTGSQGLLGGLIP